MKYSKLLMCLNLATFLFIPLLASQSEPGLSNLDEDYINSLPDNVREDVLNEMKQNQNDQEKNLTKRPSSKLSKYEVIKEWEDYKNKRLINEDSERYGLRLFKTMQSSFMPLNEPNFGNNYIVDYGDRIIIYQYGGNNNEIIEVEIERDGSIVIPEIGRVVIAGMNFDDAKDIIKKKFEASFVGVDVYTTLSEIRDINVLITGNVEFPGIYTLSGNSNILQAINIVGGVTENGSLRNIILKRKGETDKNIDLYQALIFGNIEDIPPLMSGDSIHVQSVNNLVRAGYGFNNVAIYELTEDETIDDLINYAGGLKNEAKNDNLKLVRLEDSDFITYDVSLNKVDDFKINNLDSVYAYKDKIGTITISGDVKHPGKYSISSSDRVLNIIQRSGGYLESAYPFGASLFRENAKELEKTFTLKAYQSLITYIASKPETISTGSGDGLAYILSELKNYEPTGRFITEFDQDSLKDNIQTNIYLNDGDEIHIPSYTSNVFVFGEVGNPGSVLFREKIGLMEYINKSGGLTRLASEDFIFIVSPNGETSKIQINRLHRFLSQDFAIYPGSVIYVPRHIGKVDGINLYATIAPIFSSLALSIASLNSIND
tara:strand:- start:2368 stop:4170 length:1803 start_codon:yes stop_codon:yes gene_type:complete